MPPRKDLASDQVRLRHMAAAIEEALLFIRGKQRGDLAQDRQLLLALTKELEILGEAASRVSAEFRESHPEIPWEAIIATRNRLIHGYFDIDSEVVWSTLQKDLKPVLRALKALLPGA